MPAKQERRSKLPWVVLFFFFILYSLLSLVNHYMYRTFALDLGMFNQAIYAYAHGKPATFTLDISGVETPFLATHFSPVTIIYAPFYYLFGSYTLLIIQIAAVLAGGLGIYKIAIATLPGNKPILYVFIMIQFFCCWGIFSALSYDFHNNVIGAMLVPWLIYFYRQRRKALVILFTILILSTQETMALWLTFIFAGLIIDQGKKVRFKEMFRFELPLMAICAVYAWTILSVVMPALQETQNNLQLSRYTHLGSSFSGIIINLATHPLYTFKMMFYNTIYDSFYDGIKAELYMMVLVSGGIFLLLRPVYLLMLLPIFTQKMLSNDYGFWGINGQYSIELIPIISIAFVTFLPKSGKKALPLTIVVLCSTIFFTVNALDHRTAKWYNASNNRFYSKDHFRAGLDVAATNKALASIPGNVAVSSCSRLASHIANRSKLYHFPIVKDAAYIVLEKAGTYAYPLDKTTYSQNLNKYRNQAGWSIYFENNDLVIFRRDILKMH